MIYTLIFLFLLVVYGIRFDREKAYGSYLSRERTDSIKGIFILMVFFSHIKDYIVKAGYEYSGQGDEVFQYFFSFIGQLMVVMFLFYSGYGVMESIRKKGEAYVVAMPRHRVAGTLINFDVAVLIFLVVDLLLGRDVVLSKIVLSFLAWDSLGNSNWYIFAILICYLLTCLVAKWCHTPNAVGGGNVCFVDGCCNPSVFCKRTLVV